jgi:hypothetical protein
VHVDLDERDIPPASQDRAGGDERVARGCGPEERRVNPHCTHSSRSLTTVRTTPRPTAISTRSAAIAVSSTPTPGLDFGSASANVAMAPTAHASAAIPTSAS